MSIWVALGFGSFLVVGGWAQVVNVWRTGKDVAEPMEFLVGRSGNAGFNGTLVPMLCCATTGVLSGLLIEIGGDNQATTVAAGILALMIVPFCALGASIFLFMRPRFMVPPAYRGQAGLVRAWWQARSTRQTRAAAKRRSDQRDQ